MITAAATQPSKRDYRIAAMRQKSTAIHGILTFLTVGVWSPVWMLACAQNHQIQRAQAKVNAYQQAQYLVWGPQGPLGPSGSWPPNTTGPAAPTVRRPDTPRPAREDPSPSPGDMQGYQ